VVGIGFLAAFFVFVLVCFLVAGICFLQSPSLSESAPDQPALHSPVELNVTLFCSTGLKAPPGSPISPWAFAIFV